jgi:hypothetical protein
MFFEVLQPEHFVMVALLAAIVLGCTVCLLFSQRPDPKTLLLLSLLEALPKEGEGRARGGSDAFDAAPPDLAEAARPRSCDFLV